ncbi:MAG: erythromycin esterase family protein [Bacteroidia bacterium]
MKTTSIAINSSKDLSLLLNAIGDASVVMLGEASHGTHEYYTWRTAITKKLIQQKGFSFIAVEGDWPDCYKINRYVKGYPDAETDIHELLGNFKRWPTWMWANWEVAALAEWLKEYNSTMPMEKRVGFYGLDMYSLWESLEAIVGYLEKEDPKTLDAVKKALACFEPYEHEGQFYARATSLLSNSCQDKVVDLLREIRKNAFHYDGDREAAFSTEQNARIAVSAEKYYSSLVGFDGNSWNIRDQHMMETLDHLRKFHQPNPKAVVWEHNTHIGDARATDMSEAGMVNIGQLAREKYKEENVFLVGFGSYKGKVIAGSEWGGPMQEMEVPPARKGSIEELLYSHKAGNRLLIFNKLEGDKFLTTPLPHRAIGVVYHPESEKYGNYVPSVMSKRYNAFIFLEETAALHPFYLRPDSRETPETYPFGV